jgi:anthranilate/para-aminobenzoate synthase component I
LGSTITGELKEGMSALDVVNAITPSGAVSGAPKIRSCEVIGEIEGERRGIYGATFGYIGLDGDADLFVFIHSAFLKSGTITVRAGGDRDRQRTGRGVRRMPV